MCKVSLEAMLLQERAHVKMQASPLISESAKAICSLPEQRKAKFYTMAHILFISRYYLPEKAAAAVCVSETAQRLVALGHQVTVLTTVPNYPTGIVPSAYRGKVLQEEMLDGVRVVRVWCYLSANKGFLRRILAQLSFGFTAPLLGGKAIGRPDIIVVGSPPLFNVIGARILARWKRSLLVFWVADLWPESAIQLGALKNPMLIRFSEWLEWSTYQRASLIWVVTEGMRNRLRERGLNAERLFLLHNGVDTTRFCPLPQAEARQKLGWDDQFTVVYAGTHGLSHGLANILDAAERLQDSTDIRFVLAGDGAEKSTLVHEAQRRGLKNVRFLDPFPHDQVPQLLAAADVCLAHTRKLQLFQGMLPIKMYEAMACGRPLVLALNGEAARLAVEEAHAAVHVEPENPQALVAAILHLYHHREEARVLGENGRRYVKQHFDYDILTENLNMRLLQLIAQGKNKKNVEEAEGSPGESISLPV